MTATWQSKGIMKAVQQNFRDHGAMAVGVAIGAPIAGKLLKRVARGPIRDANKLLKWSGVQSALGVKV
jgi:predicted Rossmann-fold nucleotide-binding protein